MEILQKKRNGVKNLKKYKIYAYILIVVFIILIISFGIYKVMSSNQEQEKKIIEKAQTEIKYIEDRFMVLFNNMNNIQFENYKLSITEINPSSSGEEGQKSSEGQSSGGSESSESSDGNQQESSESSGSSGENTSSVDKESASNSGKSSTKVYTLQESGILINNQDIDWNTEKNEIENMYLSLPTITLDLYQTDAQDQDILSFNSEFDNLAKIVQEENKVTTLSQLVKLYEIVTRFVEKCYDGEQEKIVARTKLNIYKAYSKLDGGNWNDISNDTKAAVEEFSKIMTGTNINDNKQYATNKIYVMLSELQNATEKQDVRIFLIKYKNTLEELTNM